MARLPQISDQEMNTAMQQLSVQQNDEFDTISALKELYIYITKYREQVCIELNYIIKNIYMRIPFGENIF